MFDVLIKNAKIVSSQEIIEGNLYIRDEKIAAVSRDLLDEGAAKVIDAAGKYAMPGVVDEHVHIIDMGQPELGKYELDSGGAAVGGITTVLEMPLSMPPSTTLENSRRRKSGPAVPSWWTTACMAARCPAILRRCTRSTTPAASASRP